MAYGYSPLPGGTARRILVRDAHICYLCRGSATQVDHVVPVSQGGHRTDPANLAAICEPCHRIKSEKERLAGLAKRARRRQPEPHPGQLG